MPELTWPDAEMIALRAARIDQTVTAMGCCEPWALVGRDRRKPTAARLMFARWLVRSGLLDDGTETGERRGH